MPRIAVVVALLAMLAGCSSGGRDSGTTTACGDMKHTISSFGATQPSTDPQSIGQAYSHVAQQVRADLGKVKDDSVRTAALRVVEALDALADDMRAIASGASRIPATTRLTTSVAQLQQACTSS